MESLVRSFILSLLYSLTGACLSLGFGKEGLSSPPETDRFVFLEPVQAPSALQPTLPQYKSGPSR